MVILDVDMNPSVFFCTANVPEMYSYSVFHTLVEFCCHPNKLLNAPEMLVCLIVVDIALILMSISGVLRDGNISNT